MFKSILTIALVIFSNCSLADVFVIYVNGAFNSSSPVEAQKQFYEKMKNNGIFEKIIPSTNFKPFHIPTLSDVPSDISTHYAISNKAAQISGQNLRSTNLESYAIEVGNLYNSNYGLGVFNDYHFLIVASYAKKLWLDYLSKGHNIIIVSHSLGNIFTEAAYGVLMSDASKREVVKKNVKLVGVGSIAQTQIGNDYINLQQDACVYKENGIGLCTAFTSILPFTSLPYN